MSYVGSITLDPDIYEAIGMRPNDCVLIANCRNGARFETYILKGERGSGVVEVNGAAAHLAQAGDQLIIMHFALMSDDEYSSHHPQVIVLDEQNHISQRLSY